MTEADITELRLMFIHPDGSERPVAIRKDYPTRLAQELLLVEAGPLWDGHKIEWPAPSDPEFFIDHRGGARFGIRLTHYGRQLMDQSKSARPAALPSPNSDNSVRELT